jgi:hypothetical protein
MAMVKRVDRERARTFQNLLFFEQEPGERCESVDDGELIRTGDYWRIAARRGRFLVGDCLRDRPDP